MYHIIIILAVGFNFFVLESLIHIQLGQINRLGSPFGTHRWSHLTLFGNDAITGIITACNSTSSPILNSTISCLGDLDCMQKICQRSQFEDVSFIKYWLSHSSGDHNCNVTIEDSIGKLYIQFQAKYITVITLSVGVLILGLSGLILYNYLPVIRAPLLIFAMIFYTGSISIIIVLGVDAIVSGTYDRVHLGIVLGTYIFMSIVFSINFVTEYVQMYQKSPPKSKLKYFRIGIN